MKLLGLLLLAVSMGAQSGHQVTLTWQDNLNPAGTVYNVYRASGVCSASNKFYGVAGYVSTKSFVDTTVVPDTYCYEVTAIYQGTQSGPSNTAQAAVTAFSPTSLTVTVQ